jgi:hypothetical protein
VTVNIFLAGSCTATMALAAEDMARAVMHKRER